MPSSSSVLKSAAMGDNPLVEWILRLINLHALKGLKRVVQENGERIVSGTVIAGFEVSKAVLARETQQMVASAVATTGRSHARCVRSQERQELFL